MPSLHTLPPLLAAPVRRAHLVTSLARTASSSSSSSSHGVPTLIASYPARTTSATRRALSTQGPRQPLHNDRHQDTVAVSARVHAQHDHGSSSSSSSHHGSHHRHPRSNLVFGSTVAAAAVAVAMAWQVYHSSPLHGDAPQLSPKEQLDLAYANMTQQEQMRERARRLGVYAWGSNRYNVVAPDAPTVTLVKTPRSIPYFDGMALRDIALEEKHGVAVDANGDVLQWGLGFFDATSRGKQEGSLDDVPLGRRIEKERANELTPKGSLGSLPLEPVKTLRGKDIVKVCASDTKVYALSRKGEVYVVSAIRDLQAGGNARRSGWSLNPLSLFGLLGGASGAPVDFEKLTPADSAKLSSGERFVDVKAGSSHVVALTDRGRTFSAPIDERGNQFGQLGTKRALLNLAAGASSSSSSSGGGGGKVVEVVMEPKMITDLLNPEPGIPATMVPDWALPPNMPEAARPPASAQRPLRLPAPSSAAGVAAADAGFGGSLTEPPSSIRYCTTLVEVPALRSVSVAEVAVGSEHCLARTAEGQVVSWGRNTHGQCGLGAQVAIDAILHPTEVVLARCFSNASVDVRCTRVAAGADNSYFVTSRREPGAQGNGLKIDVLAVGKGQWGTLGNAMWSQVAATPARVKTVSGLMEYSEASGQIHPVPIHTLAVGKPGHVAVVLDTVETEGHQAFGRDVMVWGHNAAYQLGTGRRSNLSVPQHLPPLPPLTPTAGAEAPLPPPEDAKKERLREADVKSGVLTHMPHNRLQLASAAPTVTRLAPNTTSEAVVRAAQALQAQSIVSSSSASSPNVPVGGGQQQRPPPQPVVKPLGTDKAGATKGGIKKVTAEEHVAAGAVSMAVFWRCEA